MIDVDCFSSGRLLCILVTIKRAEAHRKMLLLTVVSCFIGIILLSQIILFIIVDLGNRITHGHGVIKMYRNLGDEEISWIEYTNGQIERIWPENKS